MADTKGYGQYCPISVAAEVLAERWTPLVLRGMFCGARRFNEIQASVPRMSPALLSRRLKDLEAANVIAKTAVPVGRGFEYNLTEAGEELFPTLDAMGTWAQKWLRREIVADKNLDPDVFFWELRQFTKPYADGLSSRLVLEFSLDGVAVDQESYWLVLEPGEVDVCRKDPGYEVNLWIAASLKTLIEMWLGHRKLKTALADGLLFLDGNRADVDAFKDWFPRSHFAGVGELPPAN